MLIFSLILLKARLQAENEAAKEEIQALVKELESSQGNLSQYTDRQAKATAQKAELEIELQDAGKKLASMERERADANSGKKVLEIENQGIKKDIEDLEIAISKSLNFGGRTLEENIVNLW